MLKSSGCSKSIRAVQKLSQEVPDTSLSSENQTRNETNRRLCAICRSMPQKYVCPRCNAPYCSLLCYKSPIHSNCSEAFYRECVVEEMKNSPVNPNKTEEILERAYKMSQQDLDMSDIFMDDSLSSGDEEASSDIDDAPVVSENTVEIDAVSGEKVF